MKKLIFIVIALALIGAGVYYAVQKNNQSRASDVSPIDTQSSSDITIHIKNFLFDPSILTVKTGTKVTWLNDDFVPHTITSDSGNLLNSSTLSPGQSFSFTFVDSGSLSYHCEFHPMMKGTIIVKN